MFDPLTEDRTGVLLELDHEKPPQRLHVRGYGQPNKEVDVPYDITDLPERFQTKIKPSSSGCWVWVGSRIRTGYGKVRFNDQMVGAHRAVYEILCGPITAETLDHLCRNRACVNPEHMEQVSFRENVLRGNSMTALNARKTHCLRGHELVGENLSPAVLPGRSCLACARERAAEKRSTPHEFRPNKKGKCRTCSLVEANEVHA